MTADGDGVGSKGGSDLIHIIFSPPFLGSGQFHSLENWCWRKCSTNRNVKEKNNIFEEAFAVGQAFSIFFGNCSMKNCIRSMC